MINVNSFSSAEWVGHACVAVPYFQRLGCTSCFFHSGEDVSRLGRDLSVSTTVQTEKLPELFTFAALCVFFVSSLEVGSADIRVWISLFRMAGAPTRALRGPQKTPDAEN